MYRSEASTVAQRENISFTPGSFLSPLCCPFPPPTPALGTTDLFCLCDLFSLECQVNGEKKKKRSGKWNPIILSVLCLVSFYTTSCFFLESIHVVGCSLVCSFLLLGNIPLWLYHNLFIHHSMDIWVVSIGGPLRIKWFWTFTCKSWWGHVLLFLLGDYPEVRLLAHMVTYVSLIRN